MAFQYASLPRYRLTRLGDCRCALRPVEQAGARFSIVVRSDHDPVSSNFSWDWKTVEDILANSLDAYVWEQAGTQRSSDTQDGTPPVGSLSLFIDVS